MAKKTKKVPPCKTGCISVATHGGLVTEASLQVVLADVNSPGEAIANNAEAGNHIAEHSLGPMEDSTHSRNVSTVYSRAHSTGLLTMCNPGIIAGH